MTAACEVSLGQADKHTWLESLIFGKDPIDYYSHLSMIEIVWKYLKLRSHLHHVHDMYSYFKPLAFHFAWFSLHRWSITMNSHSPSPTPSLFCSLSPNRFLYISFTDEGKVFFDGVIHVHCSLLGTTPLPFLWHPPIPLPGCLVLTINSGWTTANFVHQTWQNSSKFMRFNTDYSLKNTDLIQSFIKYII